MLKGMLDNSRIGGFGCFSMIVSMIMRFGCTSKDPGFLESRPPLFKEAHREKSPVFLAAGKETRAGVCACGMVYETKFTLNANE